MSKLEKLIQQYCPDGVEYKTLGEVTIMKRGTSATKGIMQAGNIPVISGGRQPAFYCNASNRTGEVITVAGSGAGAGYVQYWNEPIFVCDAFSIQGNETLNTKYVYYVLTSIQEKIYSTKKGGGVPHVHISSIDKFEIPLPPLPVQEEIVRVLDAFTELQAELQAELQKRKQQYNFYCNKLLNHFPENNDVKEYFVGQLASFSYGYTSKAENNGPIRYIRITDINEKGFLNPDNAKFIPYSQDVKPYILNKNDIVMARTGATFGKTLLFNEDYPAAYASFLIKISLNDKVNPRYYWHFSKSSKYWEQANRLVGGGAQPQFNTKAISQIKIMLPPLEEQNRIVAILDRFDTLTNDLTQGLPAEIEKRRQQYEFYRDKLLTFKRKEA